MQPTDEQDITTTIKELKNGKSPDLDGITAEVRNIIFKFKLLKQILNEDILRNIVGHCCRIFT